MEKRIKSDLIKVAEVELIYKTKVKAADRFQINSSRDSYQLLRQCWDRNKIELQEEFKMILVNKSIKVLGICSVSIGGTTGTIVDPKILFSIALKSNAKGIIIAHNHPSGALLPSPADLKLTTQLKYGAVLLDISLLDHIIITTDDYYSFADSGAL